VRHCQDAAKGRQQAARTLLHQAGQVAPEVLPKALANSLWVQAEAGIAPIYAVGAALLAHAFRMHKELQPAEALQVLLISAWLGLQPSESHC
jgi:hypothetical protein